jgi:hypothetical protein
MANEVERPKKWGVDSQEGMEGESIAQAIVAGEIQHGKRRVVQSLGKTDDHFGSRRSDHICGLSHPQGHDAYIFQR